MLLLPDLFKVSYKPVTVVAYQDDIYGYKKGNIIRICRTLCKIPFEVPTNYDQYKIFWIERHLFYTTPHPATNLCFGLLSCAIRKRSFLLYAISFCDVRVAMHSEPGGA